MVSIKGLGILCRAIARVGNEGICRDSSRLEVWIGDMSEAFESCVRSITKSETH